MASLKQLAACIGLPQNFSVVGDFFGYASPPPWPLAEQSTNLLSQTGLPQSLSLLTQMQRLKQTHFHLNIIRVGTDANDLMEADDEQNLDCAVQLTRDIYAAVGIGIGRVERWWMIPLADNTGFEVIDDECEAEELVDAYGVHKGGVDCFFVRVIMNSLGFIGVYPGGSDGIVVEAREESFDGTARTMAHELGHFLGLDTGGTDGNGHQNNTPTNLMAQTKIPQGAGISLLAATQLNSAQVATLKGHDLMKKAC